jgi:hypothetical protein
MAWNLLPKVSPKTSEIQEETKEGDKLRLMASCCSVLWQKSSSYELNGIRFLAHFVTICITESMSHLGHSVAMCGRYVDEQPLTPWNGLGLNDPPGPILLVRSSKCSTHRRRFLLAFAVPLHKRKIADLHQDIPEHAGFAFKRGANIRHGKNESAT